MLDDKQNFHFTFDLREQKTSKRVVELSRFVFSPSRVEGPLQSKQHMSTSSNLTSVLSRTRVSPVKTNATWKPINLGGELRENQVESICVKT
jgi:hypothetical protein